MPQLDDELVQGNLGHVVVREVTQAAVARPLAYGLRMVFAALSRVHVENVVYEQEPGWK